jgi:endonuclease/exonuclease/phosphatase family metal-dependent hydrolase
MATVRMLHWNVHSWTDDAGRSNVDRVAALIAEFDPDVVSLVEVDETGPGLARLEALARRTGHRPVFVPSFVYGAAAPEGLFGNAILSRLPILAVRHHQLLWPPPVYDGTEPSEPRSLSLVRVDADGRSGPHPGPVWIGSTHLPRSDPAARAAALTELRAVVSVLTGSWLIAGDFNVPAGAWLNGRADFAAHPAIPTATYPAVEAVEAVDYFLLPRGVPCSARVLAAPGSDHLPVLAEAEHLG